MPIEPSGLSQARWGLSASPEQLDASAAVRELASALVIHQGDPETLADVAASARRLAERVRTGARRDRNHRMRALGDDEMDSSEGIPALIERPVGGPANPTAAPFRARRDGEDAVIAEVVFDPMFQGGSGRVHGGIVAGVFDDITGHLTTLLRVPAVTGRLTVTFRSPTPVSVPITLRAGLKKWHGKRITITAEARHGDVVTATAEALFVVVDKERFAQHVDS
ncbi:MAG: PaaI family thioesterase [Acidimicrobiia bacterium]